MREMRGAPSRQRQRNITFDSLAEISTRSLRLLSSLGSKRWLDEWRCRACPSNGSRVLLKGCQAAITITGDGCVFSCRRVE